MYRQKLEDMIELTEAKAIFHFFLSIITTQDIYDMSLASLLASPYTVTSHTVLVE
jgi:hypothetical protein